MTTQPSIKWRQKEKQVEKDRTNSKETAQEEEILEKNTCANPLGFEDLIKNSQVEPA